MPAIAQCTDSAASPPARQPRTLRPAGTRPRRHRSTRWKRMTCSGPRACTSRSPHLRPGSRCCTRRRRSDTQRSPPPSRGIACAISGRKAPSARPSKASHSRRCRSVMVAHRRTRRSRRPTQEGFRSGAGRSRWPATRSFGGHFSSEPHACSPGDAIVENDAAAPERHGHGAGTARMRQPRAHV